MFNEEGEAFALLVLVSIVGLLGLAVALWIPILF